MNMKTKTKSAMRSQSPDHSGVAEQSGLPSGATGKPPTSKEEQLPWYYEVDRYAFLPIKPKADWNHEQDIRDYEDRFGESDDHLRDTRLRIAENFAQLNRVLTAGIDYFMQKRQLLSFTAPSSLSLRQKVELFTDLLPNSEDTDYMLRFTTALARVLWLESEHSRILAQRDQHPWLYPLYHLADCIASTAFILQESLGCEHDDFRDLSAGEIEEDDGIAEEPA
jgi:hypothetical protein